MTSTGTSLAQRCCRLLQYGLLTCLLPPLLNHAALQQEREKLRTHGQLYDIGSGQMMYLRCEGEGSPTVVLDGPAGVTSDVWLALLPQLRELTRTCVFDRAGLGFSDRPMESGEERPQFPSLTPPSYTAGRAVADLHRLLTEASSQPRPIVYVGAGLGALNARLYAQLYLGEVSDLVLVDPLTEHMLEEGAVWLQFVHAQLVPSLQTLHVGAAAGLVRLLLMFGLMEPPLLEGAAQLGGDVINRQKHMLCHPRHASTVVDEHHFLNESGAQLRRAAQLRPLQAGLPVTVITGDYHDESLSPALNAAWAAGAARLAGRRVTLHGTDGRLLYRQPAQLLPSLRTIVRARRAALRRPGGQTGPADPAAARA